MLLLIGGLYGLYYMDYQEEHKEPEKVDVLRLEQPEFLLSEAPDDYLMEDICDCPSCSDLDVKRNGL